MAKKEKNHKKNLQKKAKTNSQSRITNHQLEQELQNYDYALL